MTFLKGVRIIDLTTVVLGPYATQILADMGADVIKVETTEGDIVRRIPPLGPSGPSAMFSSLNRNKRSLALDLKLPIGREALLNLAKTSDVFVHNMRDKAAEKLGFGYKAVREVNPRIVYCGSWGFGRGGPYADRPALDDIIQAISGTASLLSRAHGIVGYMPTAIADKVSSLTVAYSVAMALFDRERTGQGCEIEVPLFETMTSFLLAEHLGAGLWPDDGGPAGYERQLLQRGPYRTADGYVSIFPLTKAHWERYFALTSRPEMAHDPRIADDTVRQRSLPEIYRLVAELMPERITSEWLDLLQANEIPAAPMNSLDDVFEDPHLNAVGFFAHSSTPEGHATRFPGSPVRVNGERAQLRRPPPSLGEHNRELLTELGYSEVQIQSLSGTRPGERG